MQAEILVTIASYMDHELVRTVRSAVEQATAPERIAFAIVDQSPRGERDVLAAISERVAYVHVHPRDSLGCCWARAFTQSLYDNEDYVVQVDSHTRFDAGWDKLIVDELRALQRRTGNPRVLLSTLPTPFSYDPAGHEIAHAHRPRQLVVVEHSEWDPLERHPPVARSELFEGREAVGGRLLAAGFVAGPASWIEELRYDPMLYFNEEEISLALRAYSHGWDIWHPVTAPIRHLYKTQARGAAFFHWDRMFDTQRRHSAERLQQRSRRRLDDLIRGRLQGVYGLGQARPPATFWKEAGIRLRPAARDGCRTSSVRGEEAE